MTSAENGLSIRRIKFLSFLACASLFVLACYYPELWLISVTRHELANTTVDIDDSDFLINTLGCKLPNLRIDFNKSSDRKMISKYIKCQEKAIKVKEDKSLRTLSIINSTMHKILGGRKFSHCCYYYVKRYKDGNIEKSSCKQFSYSLDVPSEHEFAKVICYAKSAKSKTASVYSDTFAWLRARSLPARAGAACPGTWSALVLGVDTLSRARLGRTMPLTEKYLRDRGWIDFRGYHKVADNTFPNIMAALTGRNSSESAGRCVRSMYECNKEILWSTFRKRGYITAYGEDNLSLPDTFKRYGVFNETPTDHFIRPLFMLGEERKKTKKVITMCSGSEHCGERIINYVRDFVRTYQDQPSFGYFWMNSFSHNVLYSPSTMDEKFEQFLEWTETKTSIMNNTFVMFMSDHGVRYGEDRLPIEAYYEERLPALYLWVPLLFRKLYPEAYTNLLVNSGRLVTPFDLYMTLQDILRISCPNFTVQPSRGCPQCHSLLQAASSSRTCDDIAISSKWCSCHQLRPAEGVYSEEGDRSVKVALEHINKVISTINTKNPCQKCANLKLTKILRKHFYEIGSERNFVVAFTVAPGYMSYEINVIRRDNGEFTALDPVSTISQYSGMGHCSARANLAALCHCIRIKECK